MKLPRPKWYKVDDLAKYWGCPASIINQYFETGQLKLSARFLHEKFGETWLTCPLNECLEDWKGVEGCGYILQGEYVKLEDVEQFEKTDQQAVVSNQKEEQVEIHASETDVEMVKRLKLEGIEHKEIARKLKNAFQKITPSRIGRLITEEPGVHVETETYRGRGRRLLE